MVRKNEALTLTLIKTSTWLDAAIDWINHLGYSSSVSFSLSLSLSLSFSNKILVWNFRSWFSMFIAIIISILWMKWLVHYIWWNSVFLARYLSYSGRFLYWWSFGWGEREKKESVIRQMFNLFNVWFIKFLTCKAQFNNEVLNGPHRFNTNKRFLIFKREMSHLSSNQTTDLKNRWVLFWVHFSPEF